MKTEFRSYSIILVLAALIVGAVHFVAPGPVIDREAAALDTESARLRDELIRLSSDLEQNTTGGQVCDASVAWMMYELKKDTVANAQRNLETRTGLRQRETLFLSVLFLVIAALLFALNQLAGAGRTDENGGTSETRAARVRAGMSALAAAVGGAAVLAFALPSIPETGEKRQSLDLGLYALLERCEDYRKDD